MKAGTDGFVVNAVEAGPMSSVADRDEHRLAVTDGYLALLDVGSQ